MTHDELLANIDEIIEFKEYDLFAPAVRAVVELHKPREQVTGMTSSGQILSTETICSICTGLGAFSTMYPCPTIEAIKKELG